MMPNGPSKEEMKRHQAESDLHTLMEAAKIRSDKARSEAVKKLSLEHSTIAKKLKEDR